MTPLTTLITKMALPEKDTFRVLIGVLQGVITAAVLWQGNTLVNLHREVGILGGAVTMLSEQVRLAANDRYRGVDAKRDQAVMEAKQEEIKRRLEKVEGRR